MQVNASRAEKMEYLFCEMVNHLIAAEEWRKATDLFVKKNYVTLKVEAIGSQETLSDMYEVYMRLKENGWSEYAQEITDFLLVYLLRFGTIHNERFGIEDIDAVLNYRPDRTLYLRFLELGSDEAKIRASVDQAIDVAGTSLSFRARLAGLRRRIADLEGAESLLEQIVPQLTGYVESQDPVRLKELSKYEYNLGYVKFLRGSFREAVAELAKSADHAARARDPVGQWMSRCAEYRFRYLAGLASSADFERMLKQALDCFEAESSKADARSPHALRWVGNAHLHLFEIYYDRGDVVNAKLHFSAFQDLLKTNNLIGALYLDEARS